MMKNVLKDQEGVVLILVLIVLVAAIIMGVMIIKSSVQESRIAGNEQRYLSHFADIESAVNLILIENTQSIASVSDGIGNTFTTVAAVGNSLPTGTSVAVTLTNIGPPLVGTGNSTNFKTRYYTIVSTDSADDQRVTIGAYKVFPSGQTVEQ
ncbi:MAG: PilX N-terminal domain-containing pilus assembly protein [Desulfomonilia bacterium]|jgi:Tfp pilus assembly protein PilX